MTSYGSRDRNIRGRQARFLALAEGFFESRVVFALNGTGAFEAIGPGGGTLGEIADRLSADQHSLARLLNAGVMLKVLERDRTGYHIREDLQPLLLESGGDAFLGHWLKFLAYLEKSMASLSEVAMRGSPEVDLLETKDAEDLREFTLAMHSYAVMRGRELVDFLDTTGCGTCLDLGCGPGTYAFQLGAQNPQLELYLLDLAEVLETTREVESRFDLDRAPTYLPVDVTREEIPGAYDLILVSNTLHMLGEAESRTLLTRLRNHLTPGGSLVIQFQYLDEDRLGGRWAVLLDLVQLCITPAGANHSVSETTAWMESAGYVEIEFCPMSLLNTNGFLRGRVPA
jgi:SAM-dependent methyltransferase